MNKRGFTIIELLAVITILSIILVIAVPKVMGAIEESKKKALVQSAESIVRKTQENSVLFDEESKTYIIENSAFVGEELKLTGDLPDKGKIYLNNSGEIALALVKDKYCALKQYEGNVYLSLDVENCDLILSKIMLIGDNPQYTDINTPYEEPGFLAFDSYGNGANNMVEIIGAVDTSVVGNYTLKYSLKDANNNVLNEVERTVIVVDRVPPVVTLATSISNNTTNNNFVKNGEIVTLNITFSKVVTTPKVTIGGRDATVTGSGNTRIATLTIPSTESTLAMGTLAINIKDYLDIYNNSGLEQSNITSGSLVVYDRTPPTCTITKTNVGTTTGLTANVVGTDVESGISSGNTNYNALKASSTYVVTNNVGLTGSCSVTVTPQTQYRSSSCAAYVSCANSSCGCATWGNYTTKSAISNCVESGTPGINQVYVRNSRWGEWSCYCESTTYPATQPTCRWTVVARSCWYSPGSCEDSCGTACSRSTPYLGCAAWNGTDKWANNGTVCEQTTYTGSCVAYKSCPLAVCGCATWGTWSSWTTTPCSTVTNQTQCETQVVYN